MTRDEVVATLYGLAPRFSKVISYEINQRGNTLTVQTELDYLQDIHKAISNAYDFHLITELPWITREPTDERDYFRAIVWFSYTKLAYIGEIYYFSSSHEIKFRVSSKTGIVEVVK